MIHWLSQGGAVTVHLPIPKLSPDIYEALRDTARKFAESEVRPRAGQLDESEDFPTDIYKKMAGLGLFGITVPAEAGGAGLDALSYAMVMEELSRGYASIADQCGLIELIGTLLSIHGSASQKERHLPDVLAFRKLVAYCITEAEAGSDVSGVKTTAIRNGEGWLLSGSKIWIHNAPVADLGFVLARTDRLPGTAACRSSSSISMPKAFPGGPKKRRWDNAPPPSERCISTMWRSMLTLCSVNPTAAFTS